MFASFFGLFSRKKKKSMLDLTCDITKIKLDRVEIAKTEIIKRFALIMEDYTFTRGQLSDDITFLDLGMDDLDMSEVIMACEDEFDIEIEDAIEDLIFEKMGSITIEKAVCYLYIKANKQALKCLKT